MLDLSIKGWLFKFNVNSFLYLKLLYLNHSSLVCRRDEQHGI